VLFETSKGAVPACAFFNPNSIQLVGGKGAGSFIYNWIILLKVPGK